jgi:hypothetical protein
VRKADNLPPSSADVTESGSLNLSEPSEPHRPVMGMLYLLLTSVGVKEVGGNISSQDVLLLYDEFKL